MDVERITGAAVRGNRKRVEIAVPSPPRPFLLFALALRTTRLILCKKRDTKLALHGYELRCWLFVSWLLLSRGPFSIQSLNNATGRSRGFI